MITIYAPDAEDFSTLGEGALAPSECVIEEQALGQYSLTMTHPMDAGGKWRMIAPGCILKAPAPVRETPLAVEGGEGEIPSEPEMVTRKIYKVQTNTGANLHLRQGPSTSTRILSKYRPGTEVVVLSQSGGWGQVIVCSSGASGYMSMEYLVWVRDEAETIAGDAPSPQRVVYPAQSRMQLFRISSVERDAAAREVRVTAQHIFYDLLGNIVGSEYAPENAAASAVVEQLFARALNAHGFDVHCPAQTGVSGDYTRRGLVECLLDPDDGVAPQAGARLIRDNFDIWLLPDLPRETGVTIRHAKDLLGAAMTTDAGSVVTRIIPVGEDADGKPLLLSGTVYVDSPRIGDYPLIYARAIDYGVKIGQDGIANAAQARAKLTELAEADFSNGLDLPAVSLDVDFVVLGETEEYRRYADLQAVHLYDTVRVVAKEAGIDAAVRVTGYKWDALGRRYESVTLGELTEVKTSVYGYQLADKSVGTVKLQNGAVGSAQLRDLAVQYAHINTAAVEQLSANSLTALKAYIHELAAESVTTDQLYADLASIALAQITTANIENANIDWASIGALSANIATIAKAHLADADIEWAEIASLTAAVADIAEAKIAGAHITAAQIDDLNAVVAEILHAQVATGEFDFAEVENLLSSVFVLGQGIAGSVSIENLTVTQANMLGAVIGSLVLPGEDGKYYEITVGTDGTLSTAEVEVSAGEIEAGVTQGGKPIAATSINAGSIHGSTVTAQQAILNTILTQALTAGQITAGQALIASATVPTLYATSIQAIGNSLTFTANERIQLIVSSVSQAQSAAETAQSAASAAQDTANTAQSAASAAQSAADAAQSAADSAQEGADFATPLTGAEPPEEAPAAGKLWIDEGQTPSVWRRWRGADVPTDREYEETVSGNADSPAFVAIDNTQGQLQTVALEAGCVAQQAGAGDPSPSNIRAITGRESVEVVACGKNLYDANAIAAVANNPKNGVGVLADNLVIGATYTISVNADVFSVKISNTRWGYDSVHRTNITDGKYTFIMTRNENIPNDTKQYLFVYPVDNSSGDMVETAEQALAMQIQLELGSTATAYEPYTPMGGGVITPSEPLYGLPDAKDTVEVDASGDVTVTRRTAVVELDGTEDIGMSQIQGYNRFSISEAVPGIIPVTVANLNMVCTHYAVTSDPINTNAKNNAMAGFSNTTNIYVRDDAQASVDEYKSWLAAQKAAGTPVTIVYELAVPETEALTAITPITPEAGPVNIWTDADALTATVRGSGWEIINDTDGLSEGIDRLLDNVGSLTGRVTLAETAIEQTQQAISLRATKEEVEDSIEAVTGSVDAVSQAVEELGELVVSPEELVSRVTTSTAFQTLQSEVSQTANGLTFTQSAVSDIEGRVESLESGVHIGADGIGIYRSDYPYQMQLGAGGWAIRNGDAETIAARESKMFAPRVQVNDALIMDRTAWKIGSDGCLRWIRY